MGEYIQSRQFNCKELSNNHTAFSTTSKETKFLTNSNDFISLIFTLDMAVDENTNNTNSQELQTTTEDDDYYIQLQVN